eukprot:14870086-Alexandrium_andersonii.AAC.1
MIACAGAVGVAWAGLLSICASMKRKSSAATTDGLSRYPSRLRKASRVADKAEPPEPSEIHR